MARSPALATMPLRRALHILLRRHRRALVVAGGLIVAWNIANYVMTSYVPTYLTSTLAEHGETGTGKATSTLLQVIVMVAMLAVITSLGRLSDRVGRRPVLLAGSLSLVVLGLPSVWLLRQGLGGQLAGLVLMGASLVCFAAVAPSTLPAMFPTARALRRPGPHVQRLRLGVRRHRADRHRRGDDGHRQPRLAGLLPRGGGGGRRGQRAFLRESAGQPLAGAAPLTSSAELPPPPRCRPTACPWSARVR